jgi:hypothetical protein
MKKHNTNKKHFLENLISPFSEPIHLEEYINNNEINIAIEKLTNKFGKGTKSKSLDGNLETYWRIENEIHLVNHGSKFEGGFYVIYPIKSSKRN